jgi:hypothetical protein
VGDKLSFRLEQFNSGKSFEDQLSETSIFNQDFGEDIDSNLRDQICFWKQIEQIHLTKQNISNLILNLDDLGKFDLSSSEYSDLQNEWNEHLLKRRNNFVNLQNNAINSMFNLEILAKIDQVKHL